MNFLAYLCAVLKSFIFGSTFFFTGRLTETTDILDVLALRFLISFSVLWLLKTLRVIKINVGIKTFIKKNERTPFLRSLLLAALFEPVLYMLFETIGVSQTTGVTAAVIVSLSPVATLITESLVLKESCPGIIKALLGCGIAGAVYIAVMEGSAGGTDTVIGILFLVLSVMVGALFTSFSRKSSRHFKPMEITYVASGVGTIVFNAVNVIRHLASGTILTYFNPYLNVDNLIGFLFLAVGSTIIAGGMTNYAISKLHISIVAAFGGLSTLVTVLVGVIFASEQLYYYHFIGFALILVRMVGVSTISIRAEMREMAAHEAAARERERIRQSDESTDESREANQPPQA